ncbi:MAG: type 1 glutamine amidotransferase [Burkholderiaceae bacterium]|nr:type 1 glutamine amidotransferase [Burkholderiaceae bacterium]
MKPILIIQHEEDTGPGNFEHYLTANGLAFEIARVYARDPMPRSAEPFAGMCSLGGSMSVNDDLSWIDAELALMHDADQRDVPIIGHCLGGQLLAKAFGAQVTRSAMKEIGWGEVEVDDLDLASEWVGDQSAYELFQWHGDTFSIPAAGRRFLTSRLCADQAFVIERKRMVHLGMQFHVEMTPQLIRAWSTDPNGVREINAAIRKQGGDGVQRPEDMLSNVEERTQRMEAIARRIYGRWTQGLRQ